MENKSYIKNVDDQVALINFLSLIKPENIQKEEIDVLDAVGRVTYEAVFARYCDPVYNAAAMDGIAVVAEKTFSASESEPLVLEEGKDFSFINTGGAITGDYNAVIMIEDVIKIGPGKIQIITPAYPWQYIRTIGESIVVGEMLLPSRHKIRPVDIGALIAGGIQKLSVYRKPVVGIIPTGSELIEDPEELQEGRLMESNSRVFSALVKNYGGRPNRYPPLADNKENLAALIKKAAEENDIIIVNAGSSAGTKDYTVKVIEELGEVITHGIAIKPGKPTILGMIGNKPVIGIPGYPVSAYLIFELFAAPLILKYVGQENEANEEAEATLTRRIVSSFKSSEILRMALGYVHGKLVATPLERGAAAVMSLVKADGIMRIPRLREGIEAGETVTVSLLKRMDEIRKTLVITGSHDLIIDLIADRISVSSAHVGSMGGITALKRGECHLSPIHLLSEETGNYNIDYVRQYFPKRKMALIKGVERVQGLILPKGNPKNITSFADLARPDIRFANRQRGAGTRILLDYKLKQLGIDPATINGYEKELNTHMAVAISVKSGVCDVGLGVYSAAKAMEMDFVPLSGEEYDFLLDYEDIGDERVEAFIRVIKSDEFKDDLNRLGGYTFERIGEIMILEND